jgi:hypothetical protein
MNIRTIPALFIVISLTLVSASVFASKGECDHDWSANYEKWRGCSI